MKIVIATDKFKGSLTATEVAQAVQSALASKENEISLFPMADGGEGSLDVVERVLPKEKVLRREIKTTDALGREINAPVLFLDGGKSAFVEMAQVAGLQMLSPEERNPMITTTFGLGTIMRKAIVEFGANKIILAIGGSATDDGGEGIVRAMEGVKATFMVACDVENPLLGENGATMVYAPQKGADEKMLPVLEKRMEEWSKKVASWRRERGLEPADLSTFPGTGAAGGVGFAMKAVLGAELVPGWKLFSDMVGLEQAISEADIVITGEGKFDGQSLEGKLPMGVARLCRKYGKRLWLICGRSFVPMERCRMEGIEKVFELYSIEKDLQKSMTNAKDLIKQILL